MRRHLIWVIGIKTKETLTTLDSDDIIRRGAITISDTTTSTMASNGLIAWTVDDMCFTASALDSAICIRNSRWTSSVRTTIQWKSCCGTWEAQHSAHDVWGVDVPSLPSTVSFSAERTSVVVNVTLARAGVGANQGYDTLSEIVSLGPTQFLYSKFHGLLKAHISYQSVQWRLTAVCHHLVPKTNLFHLRRKTSYNRLWAQGLVKI